MGVSSFHHVLLPVRDARRSAEFFEKVSGLRKIREVPDGGVVGEGLLALPDGGCFGVAEHARGERAVLDERRTGLDPVSFMVPLAELDDWARRRSDAGVTHSEPASSVFGGPLIVLRDPDSFHVQICGRPRPASPSLRGEGDW